MVVARTRLNALFLELAVKNVIVSLSNGLTICADLLDLIQHTQTHRRLQLIHLGVDAQLFNALRPGDAEVDHFLRPFQVFLALEDNRTALACVEQLGGVEAEGGGIAVLEEAFAFVVHTKGVGGIVDDFKIVLLGDGVDGFYIAGVAEYVYGYDGTGLRGDFRLDVFRRQTPCFRVNVCKYRLDAIPLQRAGSGDEGEGGGNRLCGFPVYRLIDAQGTIGNLQRKRAV